MKNKYYLLVLFLSWFIIQSGQSAERFISNGNTGFCWIQKGKAYPILVDNQDDKGVLRAISNLQSDAYKVTGCRPETCNSISSSKMLIIGSMEQSQWIKQLIKNGKLNADELQRKREKYIIQTVEHPLDGVKEAVVIAGSDKRGRILVSQKLSTLI